MLDENVVGRVKFGDGSTVDIRGKGSVVFKCRDGDERTLHEVYFIPTLCSNIISLGQLSEDGNKVILDGGYLWVYEQSGKLLMKVQRSSNRLYKLEVEKDRNMCLLTTADETSWLWHSRLGHVNFQALQLISKNNMAYGLPILNQPKEVCTGCLLSKQTRRPFPVKSDFTAKDVLELIHGDLCGPISPPTPAGNKYFFLLVDDHSRMMWVYMLKTKDEALTAFKRYKVVIEKGTRQGIKVLRTDRGGEFCSREFVTFCETEGIQRHYTAPYSPQQNGVVERRNMTMVGMARSLLKEKKLPANLWGEAIRHAIYLLNRLPTHALSRQTPYEVWTGKKPHLEYLRIFGCLAHMKIPGVHVKKLDDRSKPVVYLGKEPGTKAHRLYDPAACTVHVSRDVVFEEKNSWVWKEQETEVTHTSSVSNMFTVVGFQTETQEEIEVGESQMSTPQSNSTIPQGTHEDEGYRSDVSSSSSEP